MHVKHYFYSTWKNVIARIMYLTQIIATLKSHLRRRVEMSRLLTWHLVNTINHSLPLSSSETLQAAVQSLIHSQFSHKKTKKSEATPGMYVGSLSIDFIVYDGIHFSFRYICTSKRTMQSQVFSYTNMVDVY